MLQFCPSGVRKFQKTDPSVIFLVFGVLGTPERKNYDISLCQYVRNWNIFHLRPVPSKNIENCALENFLKKIFFEKKNFGVSGIPQKRKRVKKFWFQKSIGIILMVILSHHRGNLGKKWRYGVTRKSKNAKIEIGLNPPPLKQREKILIRNIFWRDWS